MLFCSKIRVHLGPGCCLGNSSVGHQGIWDEGMEESVETLDAESRHCWFMQDTTHRAKIKKRGLSRQMGSNFPEDFWVEHSSTNRSKCNPINQGRETNCLRNTSRSLYNVKKYSVQTAPLPQFWDSHLVTGKSILNAQILIKHNLKFSEIRFFQCRCVSSYFSKIIYRVFKRQTK